MVGYIFILSVTLCFAYATERSLCGIGLCSNNTLCCPGERQCCSDLDLCCGEHCCRSGYECCHSSPRCCKSASKCCGDALCCPENANCCPNKKHCCPDGFTCCSETIGCCPSNHQCCGQYCCPTDSFCCPNGTGCYKDGYQCCGNGLSCPLGSQCCGEECCGPGFKCCGTHCCKEGTECCEDGCCPFAWPETSPSPESTRTMPVTIAPGSKHQTTRKPRTSTSKFVEPTSSWSVSLTSSRDKGPTVDWEDFSSWGYFLIIPAGFVVVLVAMTICCVLDKHQQTVEKLKAVVMKHIRGGKADKILEKF